MKMTLSVSNRWAQWREMSRLMWQNGTPAILAGMTTDVAGFIACDCATDRVPLPGGLVRATDR